MVAPLGQANSSLSEAEGVNFGASSAATAAVSGVVALMLQQAPGLTVPQVECILRETAQKTSPEEPEDEDTVPPWDLLGCAYDADGYSRCVGYGMVDAYEAVLAAQDCAMTWVPIDTDTELMRIDWGASLYAPGGALYEKTHEDVLSTATVPPASEDFDESMHPLVDDREQLEGNPGYLSDVLHPLLPNCMCTPDGEVVLDIARVSEESNAL